MLTAAPAASSSSYSAQLYATYLCHIRMQRSMRLCLSPCVPPPLSSLRPSLPLSLCLCLSLSLSVSLSLSLSVSLSLSLSLSLSHVHCVRSRYRAMLADIGFATRLGPTQSDTRSAPVPLVSAIARAATHTNGHRGGGGAPAVAHQSVSADPVSDCAYSRAPFSRCSPYTHSPMRLIRTPLKTALFLATHEHYSHLAKRLIRWRRERETRWPTA